MYIYTFRPLSNDFLFERRNSHRLTILARTYVGAICESKLELYPIFTCHVFKLFPQKTKNLLREIQKNSPYQIFFLSGENHRTQNKIDCSPIQLQNPEKKNYENPNQTLVESFKILLLKSKKPTRQEGFTNPQKNDFFFFLSVICNQYRRLLRGSSRSEEQIQLYNLRNFRLKKIRRGRKERHFG